MSNGATEKAEEELEQMKEQIERLAEAEKAKAEETPHPEPTDTQPEPPQVPPTPEPQKSEPEKANDDDPIEWAKSKGFKTPEDMARALLKKEQEFHASRQKEKESPPPQVPNWQPRPEIYQPTYPQYPAAYPSQRPDMVRQVAAMYPQLAPEDTEKILPVILDVARAVSKQERDAYDKELAEIRRSTKRNNELMKLMQDPAFHDKRVQREVHTILDSDPSIFQRVDEPLVYAFDKALSNMARKQLQQGNSAEESPKPPVTAGGGNGSAFTVQKPVTEKEFDSWSSDDQRAYINSNGRILPKNRR